MLSRTADHLFWMARYTERAENTARLLDVNLQTTLLPQTPQEAASSWRAILAISELTQTFEAKHERYLGREVLEFMVNDPQNPSSIYSCLQAARENARAVRGSLTTEVWETHNTTWLDLQHMDASTAIQQNPRQFFEWVKLRSHLSRGVTVGTMLKGESYQFIRLGTHLERCDNTARILDVRFYDGNEDSSTRRNGLQDFYHWNAVLRSVSAFEMYRNVYRDVITPERVAELLMLRSDMPRSLLASLQEVQDSIELLKNRRSDETARRVGLLVSFLRYARIQDIFDDGLHPYLTKFLEQIGQIGDGIAKDFLVPFAV